MSHARLYLIIAIHYISLISYATPDTDTSMIRSCIKKADYYCSINIDSAFFYCQKMMTILPFINDPYLVSQVYKTQGDVFSCKYLYDSAEYYYKRAFKHIPKDLEYDLAILFNDYAKALIMQNKLDSALLYLQNSLTINNKLQLKKGLMKNYANFADIYKQMGAFDISTRYIFQGLPMAEELKDTLMLRRFYYSIGVNYGLMKKPKLEIIYCQKALDCELAKKKYDLASESTNAIAVANRELMQYKEAIRYFRLSYNYANRTDYKVMEAVAYANLGSCFVDQNQFDSAFYYLSRSNIIAQEVHQYNVIASADITYGEIYTKTKQYNKALKHLFNAINNKDQVESNLIDQAYLQLSKLYEAMGNYPKAYKYHLIYSQRNDSTMNKEKSEEIANIKMQYELTKKQEQLDAEARQKEAKMQAETDRYKLIRNITIIGFFVVIIIATLVIINFKSRQRQKLYDLKNEINSYRQRLMVQQMNPHFIFNTLNSIQHYIYNNKKEESMDFISQFAKLMRLNLYNSQNDIITLKDEIEALKIYLELEQIRMENKFDYTIEIDPNIDLEKQIVPSFLIQPLVENSIKHGFLKIEHKGSIQTKINLNNGNLVYSIIDNGIGFKNSKKNAGDTKHKSLGLELTKKRLISIGVLNNTKTDLTFTDISGEDGTCLGAKVDITIPSSLRFI